jgi:hypothetical protein
MEPSNFVRAPGHHPRDISDADCMRSRGPIHSAAAVATFAILISACAVFPVTGTKGTMPPPGPDGRVDSSTVPVVAVAGPNGPVGYVSRDAVSEPGEDTWPVYGDDLRTVVGHLAPGRGFVPVGVDPATIQTFAVVAGPASPGTTSEEEQVLAYVRNESPSEAWIAVLANGLIQPGGGGFPGAGYVGVWCDAVPAGSRLVLLDSSPADPAALPRLTIQVGRGSAGEVSRWIEVAADGTATVGSGVPGWWTGGPPPC